MPSTCPHLLDGYDPVPGLVARGVMSDEHDPDACEADCCNGAARIARSFGTLPVDARARRF